MRNKGLSFTVRSSSFLGVALFLRVAPLVVYLCMRGSRFETRAHVYLNVSTKYLSGVPLQTREMLLNICLARYLHLSLTQLFF